MAGETPVPQTPQIPEPDDGLTAAEREYFKTGGTASDALLAENVDYKPPAVDPNAPPAPATPGAQTPAATPGAQTPPAAGDKEFDTDDDSAEAQAARAAGKTPKRVNYNKFKRTEDELTTTKAALAKATETSTRIDERMKLINEALAATPATPQQAAAEDADPAPDPEKDIFGYVRWQGRQIERLNTRLEEGQAATNEDRAGVELSNWYRDQAVSYARDDATFLGTGTKETSAYTYLIQSRLGELASMGVAEQEAKRIVLGEERAIVEKARKDGVSPAKIITTLAAGRGFNKEAATAAIAKARNPTPAPAAATVPAVPGTPLGGTPPANQNPTNGTQAAPAVPATPNVAAEIQAIKNAQPSALSLSGGGGVPADPLTPQMLADMPEDEFAAVLARLSPTRQRELFGT